MDGPATEDVGRRLRRLKEGPAGAIAIGRSRRSLGRLEAVGWDDAADPDAVERLARWHAGAFARFPEPFAVTPAGAQRWLVDRVLADPRRALFWVRGVCGEYRGHVGLTRIDVAQRWATVGDAVACHPRSADLLAAAVETLAHWARSTLGLNLEFAPQARAAA